MNGGAVLILAIDPGPETSGVVHYDAAEQRINAALNAPNDELLALLGDWRRADVMVIEQIKSYGMGFGDTLIDTIFWTGRFVEAWARQSQAPWVLMPRKTAVANLCCTAKAGNAQVSAAIRERFPQTGGGARPSVGTKAKRGPLFILKQAKAPHVWQALALALTYQDQQAARILREERVACPL